MSSIQVRISLRVSPNAPRNEIIGFQDDILHVKIAAPPLEGKANAALVAYLSKRLGINKSLFTIVSGHRSRNKVIGIEGFSHEEISRLLSDLLSSSGATSKPAK